MAPRKLVLLFCLLVVNIGLTIAMQCLDTGRFEANGTFAKIREIALRSLASNVIEAGGFFNTTLGNDSSRIYALALCREGHNQEACFTCVNDAAHYLLRECLNQTEAFSWGGDVPCLVRYSDRSIFGPLQLQPVELLPKKENIRMNLIQCDEVWDPLMNRTLEKASSGSSRLKYCITAKKEFSPFQYIYVFMQCNPDLAPKECRGCLQVPHGYYKTCCHGWQGGVVARPSCFCRWDLYPYYNAFNDVPLEASPPRLSTKVKTMKGNESTSSRTFVIIIISILVFVVLIALVAVSFAIYWRRKFYTTVEVPSESKVGPSFRFDLSTLRDATGGFSLTNKLGQGGFGAVYKGDTEFKNEVSFLTKLQHKNLVKLLGFCLEGSERILLYEFVPNSSLDSLITDPIKRSTLTWDARYKIIEGIAQGLLYLHEDSALRIIHRDLKGSNILLDADMNPKISDFGMARMFTVDQSRAETSKVVGTYGYMPPEYIMHGRFSVKSDVYSFGVVILEIISGQKNKYFQRDTESESLQAYAWRSWSEGNTLELLDPNLRNNYNVEIFRCIHVGLLCVQEDMEKRPTMNSVVNWLKSDSTTLPPPSRPAFISHYCISEPDLALLSQVSKNSVSITELVR